MNCRKDQIKFKNKYFISLPSFWAKKRSKYISVVHHFCHRTTHESVSLMAPSFDNTGVQLTDSAETWSLGGDQNNEKKNYLISLHSVYFGARKVLTYLPHQFLHRTSHALVFLVALRFHITGVQPADSAEIWGREGDEKIIKKNTI